MSSVRLLRNGNSKLTLLLLIQYCEAEIHVGLYNVFQLAKIGHIYKDLNYY